jgi:hypothetical protein
MDAPEYGLRASFVPPRNAPEPSRTAIHSLRVSADNLQRWIPLQLFLPM